MIFGLAVLFMVSSTAAAQQAQTSYRIGGASALRPAQIWDDGSHTYIVWPADSELPAVFSIGSDGREVLADGQMREGRYVLDRVHSSLVFRIDQARATARRRPNR